MPLHVQPRMRLSGRYRLTARLVEVGNSEVFTAFDEMTRSEVIVKFQRPRDVDDTWEFQRSGKQVRVEARLGRRLRKVEGLALTMDRGDLAGREFLVLEKVIGMTLEDYRLKNIPVRSPFAASVIYQLAATLHEIHEMQYVHRDVKTENALIQWDGRVRLIDLGLAAKINPIPTRAHLPSGTTGYRAPEQYDPWGEITPRIDIYALGCILFEMSVMQLPYQDYDGLPPRDARPFQKSDLLDKMPEPLRALGLAMIAHDPADRPQSMAELCEALTPLVPEVGAPAEPDAGPIDPTAPLRRGQITLPHLPSARERPARVQRSL